MKITRTDIVKLSLLWGLCALVIFAGTMHGQTWKGGNTADYDANSVCSDVYLLHRAGTTFPTDTRAECCVDTVYSYGGIDTVITASGDTVVVPVPYPFGHDTVVVMTTGGISFTSWKEYFCDSIFVSIDTSTSDTAYCTFCDSITRVSWFTINVDGDSLLYDTWQFVSDISRDSCSLYGGIVSFEAQYNYYDTTINNAYISYDTTNCGFWVYDSLADNYKRVDCGDTLNIGSYTSYAQNNSGGVWVRSCVCDTGYIFITDSLVPFLSLDNTWTAYYGGQVASYIWSTDMDSAKLLIGECRYNGGAAIQAASDIHSGYMEAMVDSIGAYFSGVKILANGDSVDCDSLFLPDYRPSNADLWSYWTRNIANSYFDTLYSYAVIDTPPTLDYIPPFETPASWWLADGGLPRAITGWPSGVVPSEIGLHRARSIRFERTVDFSDWFTPEDISMFNATQPRWKIFQASDDNVPYISINGVVYDLDTVQADAYTPNVYTISPTGVDYSQVMKLETGVHSWQPEFIGMNMLISIEFPTGDSIPACVWTKEDSLIVPPCSTIVYCTGGTDSTVIYLGQANELPSCGGADCSDSICFFFPQGWGVTGWTGFRRENDTTICFSTCELDTLDLSSQSYGGTSWLPFFTSSSDSVDTFEIATYADSVVMKDLDFDPIKIRSSGLAIGASNVTGQDAMAWGDNNSAGNAYATAWGRGSTSWGNSTTTSGLALLSDSTASYSFHIGIDDTLSADSTFRSAYPYNEFGGAVKIEGLTLSNTDSILTIDGSGNVHYVPSDSIGGGGTTLLSYAENGTFTQPPNAGTGTNNVAIGYDADITDGDYNIVLGGSNNEIKEDYGHSTICGGKDNTIDSDWYNIILGGYQNSMTGGGGSAHIVGGYQNTVGGGNQSVVLGALCSSTQSRNFVFGIDVDVFTSFHTAFYDSAAPGYFTINTNDAVAPSVALEVGGGILSDSLSTGAEWVQLLPSHGGLWLCDTCLVDSITVTTADTFYFPDGLTSNNRQNMTYVDSTIGDCLIIDSGYGGQYQVNCTVSFNGTNGARVEAVLFKNSTRLGKLKLIRTLGASAATGNASFCGYTELSDGDVLRVGFTSDDNGDMIYIEIFNLIVTRLFQ